jgi:hypothetical protein
MRVLGERERAEIKVRVTNCFNFFIASELLSFLKHSSDPFMLALQRFYFS